MRAKAKELNAINHMLMEDTVDEALGSNVESSSEQLRRSLDRKDTEERVASSSSSSSSSVESYTTTIHDEEFNSLPLPPLETIFEDITEVADVRRKRVGAANSDILKKQRNAMRELKRLSDNKLAKLIRSNQSNVFPFTSTEPATRSPDQLYHSDDELLSASSDKLRG